MKVPTSGTDAFHGSESRRARPRSWLLFAVILGVWAFLSLFLAPELYLYALLQREAIPWRQALSLTFINTGIAALFTPGIIWLARHFPLERGHRVASLAVHVPSCLVFSLGHAWLYWLVCYADHRLSDTLLQRFHSNLVTYWAIVAVTAAFDYFAKYRERERQLREAQLTLLKSQLQPHFLFNTLHTISAMMHEDIAGADRMVSRLSDLLRLTLEHIGKHEVTLRDEVEFLKSYFEIERVRFDEGLGLSVEVDPEALDAFVPSMILQPLVENSIRHGFGARGYTGSVTVRASRRNDSLVMSVRDDGLGLGGRPSGPVHEGVGLTNIRKRLEQLYPAAHRLCLENLPGGGAVTTVEVPFRLTPVRGPEAREGKP